MVVVSFPLESTFVVVFFVSPTFGVSGSVVSVVDSPVGLPLESNSSVTTVVFPVGLPLVSISVVTVVFLVGVPLESFVIVVFVSFPLPSSPTSSILSVGPSMSWVPSSFVVIVVVSLTSFPLVSTETVTITLLVSFPDTSFSTVTIEIVFPLESFVSVVVVVVPSEFNSHISTIVISFPLSSSVSVVVSTEPSALFVTIFVSILPLKSVVIVFVTSPILGMSLSIISVSSGPGGAVDLLSLIVVFLTWFPLLSVSTVTSIVRPAFSLFPAVHLVKITSFPAKSSVLIMW